MKTQRRMLALFVAFVAAIATAGCASTGPVQYYEFADGDEALPFEAWLAGQAPAPAEATSAQDAFLRGEAHYWEGDLEAAFDVYSGMLRQYRGHPLNRYAAYRLYGMRFDIVDYERRMAEELQGVRFDEESPLTRQSLARIAHFVARGLWIRSDSEEPFSFVHGGAISQWRATPNLSPWRLGDFDEVFEPERIGRLSQRYRTPQVAAGHPANWRPTKVVDVDQPGNRMELGRSGIYYLESWIHIEGNRAKDITLNGHFPGAAKVWIAGQEVMERREEAYEAGRLLREITLEPGYHRVLVKLAYRPGYRDWFELLLVPTEGEVFGQAGIATGLGAGPDMALAAVSDPGFEAGGLTYLGDLYESIELEPVQVGLRDVTQFSGPTLYAAALSAHASGEAEQFDAAWGELMERHPEFAPGHLLASYQVRTRWDMPSDLRDAATMSHLRQAAEWAPDNLHVLVRLERWLRDQGNDREHRQVLERARDRAFDVTRAQAEGSSVADESGQASRSIEPGARAGQLGEDDGAVSATLRQIRPLVSWARYLEQRGWSEDAEVAWRHVLSLDATNCSAARQLQNLYYQRNYFPPLEEISPAIASCPDSIRRWLGMHPEHLEEQVEFMRRQALRHPYDRSRQQEYAEALRAAGRVEEAAAVFDEAIERMPEEFNLWTGRVELALLSGDDDLARRLLDDFMGRYGRSVILEMQRARLDDELPLQDLMIDGLAAAMEEVRRTGSSQTVDESQEEGAMALDDAYLVVDFRGQRYLDDGSSWTLTHQIVRVMTRGAIDRYAEISLPSGGQLLLARTIKEDGEVRVPEDIPGKSTLSMPGLAEGDMVELAYLEFHSPLEVASHAEGRRFFFQRSNLSSRYSEFVLLDSEEFSFEGLNGAPAPETFEWNGREASRFIARDVRRPRAEPRSVASIEYLPWVREYRVGVEGHVLDVERRYLRESVRDSARPAPVIAEQVQEWLGRPMSPQGTSDDDVHRLFYGVASLFRNPSPGSFGVEAAHAVQHRRGSPLILLHTVLEQMGVDNDIYLARSDEQPPQRQPLSEIARFRQSLMRVVMPESEEVVWLEIGRTDAMFGAVEPEVDGQPAICVTCDEFREDTVSMAEDRRASRHIELVGELTETGDLLGTIDYRFEGMRAVRVRAALRGRADEEDRRRYFERVLTDQIGGATLTDFDVRFEDEPHEALEFTISFERPQFARASESGLIIDQPVFEEPMQRIYAPLATRNLPMFVGYDRRQTSSMHLTLPEGMEARLRAPNVEATDTAFGHFERRSWLDDGTLRVETSIHLPRQRVQPEDYAQFRAWATEIEESASVWLGLSI